MAKGFFKFYGSFISKTDAEKKAKRIKGAKVRPVKMRGKRRFQVYVECD